MSAWFTNTELFLWLLHFLAPRSEVLTALYFSLLLFLTPSSTVLLLSHLLLLSILLLQFQGLPLLFLNFYFYEQISETARVHAEVISDPLALMPTSVICLLTSFPLPQSTLEQNITWPTEAKQRTACLLWVSFSHSLKKRLKFCSAESFFLSFLLAIPTHCCCVPKYIKI